ncbi:hypothetical protein QWY75_00670 [Pontixanthobacter aestiaquae]|uniref:Uncharacterized protein n=1 Tax=Pontixanthobacter aestiaquae TaxID=1509367 RepID=A0A844ZAF4_9SPHN|nr:hypothetical protein [Pontixanthobacter aestiaquae]MDN3644711.1 hypothetical protein [Pontixanthobacter aestiaquae]MXO84282.1 hypothetical protein [Pontixanthobacter aestiaquae]
MKLFENVTPSDWLSAFREMIAAELRAYFLVFCGLAIILILGFAVPIVGQYLAQEQIRAETAAEVADEKIPQKALPPQPVIQDYRANADDGWSDDSLVAAQAAN